ncbi:MAG: hypothetical protein JXR83_06640 [Deltaproteobacteria bacterium]|nr:hypothetical protein [Deltaproteobacteria bacterium]
MRALVVTTGTAVAPFGDDVGDSLLLCSTLQRAVAGALSELGLAVHRAPGADGLAASADELVLVLADRLFVSRKLLRDFLPAALARLPAQLWLRRTPSVDYLLPVTDAVSEPLAAAERETSSARLARIESAATERVGFDLFLLRGRELPRDLAGDALLAALRQRCGPVVVTKRELTVPMRLPIVGDAGQQMMALPITSTLAAEVRHWVHILWLNQLAFGMAWMDLLRDHKLWALWRLATAFPFGRARLFRRLVRSGKNCRIHPTAHVELSVLGDNVVVGPRASIRNSVVGDGCEIGDHAVLLSSTVASGAFVTAKTFFVFSAAYPGATIGNYKLQVSLIGRDAHINSWAGLIDAKLRGDIRVERDGALRSTGRSFLGSCVGHRAVVASKILVQPGRMIPNDAVIVMRPDEVVSAVPADLPPGEPLVRHQGTLVPLATLKNG